MNISNLPIYYTKLDLTSRYTDYSNVILLPLICAFGIATNVLCIVVAFKHDERERNASKSLDYILLNSFIDLIFLLFAFPLFVIRCGALCPYGYSFGAKFFEIYIYLYGGYTLVTSQVFLSIYVAHDRLSMFSGKVDVNKTKKLRIYHVYIVCFVISSLANAPVYLVSKEVSPLGLLMSEPNSTSYEVLYIRAIRSGFNTKLASYLLTACLAVKDPFMFIVFTLVNVFVCIKFRAYLKSREALLKKSTSYEQFNQARNHYNVRGSNETHKRKHTTEKREFHFTQLTLVYCLVYLIGNFIDCFSLIANIFSLDVYGAYWYFSVIANCFLFMSHGVHFFICYYFNSVFRKEAKKVFIRVSNWF